MLRQLVVARAISAKLTGPSRPGFLGTEAQVRMPQP